MKQRAFTLIELLVVIAIIAVLMGILMPGLQAARDHAKRIQCTSNIKNLGMGWFLYAGDYDGKLVNAMVESVTAAENARRTHPWVVTPTGTTDEDLDNAIKKGSLYTYVGKSVEVYRCPSDTRYRVPVLNPYRSYSIADGANGEDWLANEYTKSKKLSDIKRPGEKYIFVEDIDTRAYNTGSWTLGFVPQRWIDPLAVWHKRRSTMGYADGHAETHAWSDKSFLDWAEGAVERVMTASTTSTYPSLTVDVGSREDYDYMVRNYPCKSHR